jgi:small subunit ribosomal protein S27Ae
MGSKTQEAAPISLTPPPPPSLSGIPASAQRVLFAGRPLTDSAATLAALGVSEEDTLHVLLRLLGGGKKRKKKTYTKPKKQKHKHKVTKLGVLKYYKVDDSGKVERLRQACTACGPATFMAKHFDRLYCGKCHVTYMVEGGAAASKGKGKKGK